jgi:hypothetical protein
MSFINFIIDVFFGKPKEYKSIEKSKIIDEEAEKYPEDDLYEIEDEIEDDLYELEAYERQEHQEYQERFEKIEEDEACHPDTCWGECQSQGWCDIAKDYRSRIHKR